MSVKLLIKSPNQQIGDFEVSCDFDWTVSKLKDHLNAEYPSKPLQIQQRIIYRGRVLPDHLLLNDVLIKNEDIHKMHLVCPSSTFATVSSSNTENRDERVTNSRPGPSTEEGLRQRNVSPQNNQFNIGSPQPQGQFPPTGLNPVAFPADMAYQMALMQQTYAQMMAQFYAQSQGQVYPGVQAAPTAQVPADNSNSVPLRNEPRVQIQNLAGDVDNDRHQDRDVIDFIYLTIRVCVLVTVLSFYSSIEKVILVTFFGLLVLLYHKNAQYRRAHPLPEEQQPPPNPVNRNAHDAENEEGASDDSPHQENPNSNPLPPAAAPSGITYATVFAGVKAFFTSLIPDPLPAE